MVWIFQPDQLWFHLTRCPTYFDQCFGNVPSKYYIFTRYCTKEYKLILYVNRDCHDYVGIGRHYLPWPSNSSPSCTSCKKNLCIASVSLRLGNCNSNRDCYFYIYKYPCCSIKCWVSLFILSYVPYENVKFIQIVGGGSLITWLDPALALFAFASLAFFLPESTMFKNNVDTI